MTVIAIIGFAFLFAFFVWSPFVAWRKNRGIRNEQRLGWDAAQRYREQNGLELMPDDERP